MTTFGLGRDGRGSTLDHRAKYKEGEKKIVVPSNVPIVRYEIGGKPISRRSEVHRVRDQEAGRHARANRINVAARVDRNNARPS